MSNGPFNCDEHNRREILQRESGKIDACVAEKTVYFPDVHLTDKDRKTLVKKYGALRRETENKSARDVVQAKSTKTKPSNPMSACYGYLRHIGHGKSNLLKTSEDFDESRTGLLENVAPIATRRKAE